MMISALPKDMHGQGRRLLADLLSGNECLTRAGDDVAILLSGSMATEFADDYSGVDLLFVCPDERLPAVVESLGGDTAEPGEVRVRGRGRSRLRCYVWPVGHLSRQVAERDDGALYALSNAHVLRDPTGLAAKLIEGARMVPQEVWHAKASECYRHFRQRKASLAWALRRGLPFVCLDNLMQSLTCALQLCYYLEERPPANRKWLFRGALRTRVGRELRPTLFQLFSSLGEIAVMGGSFTLRHNRIYAFLSEVQRHLEGELRDRRWLGG